MGAVGLVADDLPLGFSIDTVVLIGWVVVVKVVFGVVTVVDEIEDDVGVADGDVCDDTLEEAWTKTETDTLEEAWTETEADGIGVCNNTEIEAWTETSVKGKAGDC